MKTEKTVVNYLWMRDRRTGRSAWRAQGGKIIPASEFANFQFNAKKYPDAEFHLWLEDPGVCKPYALPANTTIHALDSLPSFSQIPALSSGDPTHFWAGVDITKLMILQHMLSDPDVAMAVFSDFDVPDLRMGSAGFRKRIGNYGAVFGASYYTSEDGKPIRSAVKKELIGTDFENGFIAFHKSSAELLDSIISAVKDISADRYGLVFQAMQAPIRAWEGKPCGPEGIPFPYDWVADVGSFYVQPGAGHKFSLNRTVEMAADYRPSRGDVYLKLFDVAAAEAGRRLKPLANPLTLSGICGLGAAGCVAVAGGYSLQSWGLAAAAFFEITSCGTTALWGAADQGTQEEAPLVFKLSSIVPWKYPAESNLIQQALCGAGYASAGIDWERAQSLAHNLSETSSQAFVAGHGSLIHTWAFLVQGALCMAAPFVGALFKKGKGIFAARHMATNCLTASCFFLAAAAVETQNILLGVATVLFVTSNRFFALSQKHGVQAAPQPS